MVDKFTDDSYAHWQFEPPPEQDPEVRLLAMLEVGEQAGSDEEAQEAIGQIAGASVEGGEGVREGKDSSGHEHKGKGKGGGQFVKGGGSGGGDAKKKDDKSKDNAAGGKEPAKNAAAKPDADAPAPEPAPAEPDPAANRPSKPEERHKGAGVKPNVPPTADVDPSPGSVVGAPEHAHADYVSTSTAKALGGKTEEETADAGQKDKKPYDVQVPKASGKGHHDIEVKSLLKGKKKQLSVHDDALLRKVNHATSLPDNTFHTVARDERDIYGRGQFAGNYSGQKIYYKRGSGKYRLSEMHPVKDEVELKRLLDTSDDQLPEAARGSLPPPPPLEELRAKAARESEARRARDRALKEKNKDKLRDQARARAALARGKP